MSSSSESSSGCVNAVARNDCNEWAGSSSTESTSESDTPPGSDARGGELIATRVRTPRSVLRGRWLPPSLLLVELYGTSDARDRILGELLGLLLVPPLDTCNLLLKLPLFSFEPQEKKQTVREWTKWLNYTVLDRNVSWLQANIHAI
jgi:hypothetical protein